jgi:hypothetical protein
MKNPIPASCILEHVNEVGHDSKVGIIFSNFNKFCFTGFVFLVSQLTMVISSTPSLLARST